MFLFDQYTRKRTALITKLANYLNSPATYKAAIQRIMKTTQLKVEAVNELIISLVPDVDIEEQVNLQRAVTTRYATIICDASIAVVLPLGSIYAYHTTLPYVQRALEFLKPALFDYIDEARDVYSKIGTAIAPLAIVRVAAITSPTLLLSIYALVGARNAVITGYYVRAVAIAPIIMIAGAIVTTSCAKSLVGIACALAVNYETTPDIKTIVKVVSCAAILGTTTLVAFYTMDSITAIVGAKARAGALAILSSVAIVGTITTVTEGDYVRVAAAVGIPAMMGIVVREGATIVNAVIPASYVIVAANEVAVAAAVLGTALIIDIGALAGTYKIVEIVQMALSKLTSNLIVTSPEIFKGFCNDTPSYIATESSVKPTDLAVQTQASDQKELKIEALEQDHDQHVVNFEAYAQALIAQNNPTTEVGILADHIA